MGDPLGAGTSSVQPQWSLEVRWRSGKCDRLGFWPWASTKPCVVFVLLRVGRLIGSENSTAPTWNVEAGVSEPMAGVQTSYL